MKQLRRISNDKAMDRNPRVLGGNPAFSGTRLPIRILIEYPDGYPHGVPRLGDCCA